MSEPQDRLTKDDLDQYIAIEARIQQRARVIFDISGEYGFPKLAWPTFTALQLYNFGSRDCTVFFTEYGRGDWNSGPNEDVTKQVSFPTEFLYADDDGPIHAFFKAFKDKADREAAERTAETVARRVAEERRQWHYLIGKFGLPAQKPKAK